MAERDLADLPRPVVRGLRREAFRQIQGDPRRVAFPPVLHVGRLDCWPAEHDAIEVPRASGAAWMRDVVEMLLLARRTDGCSDVWLTRPGDAQPDHLDLGWTRALREVESAYDIGSHRFFVITRSGWTQVADDASGAQEPPQQRWSRLRVVLPAA